MKKDSLPVSCRWFIATTLVLFAGAAHAQDYVYATGNPNFGVHYPVPDGYINITNGNVHLNIPLGTFKQRGNLPPIAINLEYDSRIWHIVDNGGYSWQPTNVPNSQAGWRLVTGLETGNLSYSNYFTDPGSCGSGQQQQNTEEVFTDFVWSDGQGTKHTFQAELDQGLPMCGTTPPPASTSGWAIDSSGYSIYVSYNTNVNGDIQATIYDNKGNEVYPEMMDPYGNTAFYSSGTVTDSIGRKLLTTSTSGNTTTYNVLTEGGAYNHYIVTTEPVSVGTDFAQSAVSEYSGTLTAIESIGLPDGSSYAFTYDTAGYGELKTMTLPTSGQVTVAYENYLDSYQNQNRWIDSETDAGGASFTPQVLTQCSSGEVGCQEKMTVSPAGGGTRVYTLTLNDGAWDGQTVTYLGSTSGPATMTVANNYNFQSYQCPSESICYGAEYIAASCSQVTLNDTGQTAETTYSYDTPWTGRISSKKEYDYGAAGSGGCTTTATPSRETDYTYGAGFNGAPYVTEKTVEVSGTPYSQTVYNYTSGPLPTSVVKGGVNGGPQTTTSYVYDSNGMKTSETDPNGNMTSYSYGCTDLFLNKTTYPMTSNGVSHITQADVHCNSGGGLPKTTTDENSQITTYGYDSFGRESTVSYPDGGEVSYEYQSPNVTKEARTVSSSVSYTKTTTLDSFGRVDTVATSDPAGTDTVTTAYDGDNRVYSVTNPVRGTDSTTDTYFSYDALDRPILITQPDQHTIQVTYSGNQATVTDEDGNEKSYTYDAFHDLTKVMEPNSSGTLAWETDYSYDAAGHLTSVVQGGSNSGVARTRTLTYDDLGRLTQEITPEAGTKSYTYDNNGNVKTVTSGRGTITYDYDALNRLTSETGTGLDNTFTYDVGTTSGGFTSQNPIGNLVMAANGSASEQYSYDPMNRVIYQTNCIPTDCSQTGLPVSAAYDYAGDLTSLTYPDGRVLTMGFDEARHLTGVEYTSWNGQSQASYYLSSPSYYPTGQMEGAAYGNGVQIAASFNNRLDISALSYSYNGEPEWSKQYTWTSNGKNLTQITDEINPAQTYSFSYDTDNRLISASGGGQTLVSPATSGTGTVTIGGTERHTLVAPPGCRQKSCMYTVYDSGNITVTVDGVGESAGYGNGSTSATIASALVTAINGNSSYPVAATVSGSTISLTAKATGANTNYSLSTSVTWDSTYFSTASFGATPSGSALTGGANAVYSGADVLSETYSPDAWGDLQESGNFTFTQSFNTLNRVSAYSYDGAGDLLSDGINSYTWNVDGTLASTGSAQYTYDALEQRVEKTGGSGPGEFIYFNGMPIAVLSGGSWTDLIWAGKSMIAEVPGSETAAPVYRLLDNEGSLIGLTDSSGTMTGTMVYAPYGQVMSNSITDSFGYAGLYQDTEYGGDHAWYRSLSTEQIRWLSPDPYNGSYDLMDPQSLNRYMYVNGNPLGFTDPSGLVDGWATGIGGTPCSVIDNIYSIQSLSPGGFNYCNPVASALTFALSPLLVPIADEAVTGVNAIFGTTFSTSVSIGAIVPYLAAAITIGCSIDNNTSACGPSGLTSLIPGAGGDVGKGVGDGLAVASAVVGSMCLAGTVANPVCDAFIVYNIANALYSFFNSLFNGPAQFTGSLLPRPSDLGGLGTAPIGIPNQNLTIKSILGQPSRGAIPSPGMHIQ